MVRNTITLLFPFCLTFLLLTSCGLTGKNRKKPASTGQPYEIVLEGDTDSIVTRILTEDVPALPQPEPLCKLIQVKKGKTKGSYLLVRTRIIVNITDKDFAVKLSHDENAAPQNIIRINAHSVQQLRRFFRKKLHSVRSWDLSYQSVSGWLMRDIIRTYSVSSTVILQRNSLMWMQSMRFLMNMLEEILITGEKYGQSIRSLYGMKSTL